MENSTMPATEIEKVLSDILGVISTKVVINENEIVELHVMATIDRNPKQISRDIQSILFVNFNINCDHKKISIAQVNHSTVLKSDKRIEIDELFYTTSGNLFKVGVSLTQNGTTFRSEKEGLNTTTNSSKIIANATLEALRQIIGSSIDFIAEDVDKITIGKNEIIVVAITVVLNRIEETLLGTSIVHGDIKKSIVKATLDAVNRKIVKL
ncbi:MAG: hypothetical protein COA82_07740 [Alkaliphilus sp.]|nr:hypothetical protein [bacterium AH-315-L21]MBN4067579.1 hypothetical protein [Alkaliphilus transvaalensis]PHS33874.1 MAG: hypothetical protein COA82_07740 [Alkaliphilus sp.]